VSGVVQELTGADQVYTGLWAHAGREPGHFHFVGNRHGRTSGRFRLSEHPGPSLQVAMFLATQPPDVSAVAAFCDRARAGFTRRSR
jgi:hypothetical protein